MQSLIESRFGHIVPGLTANWGNAERFERYFGTLVFDTRWDRSGWPKDAWEELVFLQSLHRLAYAEQYPRRNEVDDEIKWV